MLHLNVNRQFYTCLNSLIHVFGIIMKTKISTVTSEWILIVCPPSPPQGQRGLPGEQGFRGLPGPGVSDSLPFSYCPLSGLDSKSPLGLVLTGSKRRSRSYRRARAGWRPCKFIFIHSNEDVGAVAGTFCASSGPPWNCWCPRSSWSSRRCSRSRKHTQKVSSKRNWAHVFFLPGHTWDHRASWSSWTERRQGGSHGSDSLRSIQSKACSLWSISPGMSSAWGCDFLMLCISLTDSQTVTLNVL